MSEETEDMKPLATFYAYDDEAMELYAHALNYSVALYDIENRLRADYKYNDKLPEGTLEYIEKLRDFISELKADYHLPLD